jgi:hypothetical protein
MAPDTVKTITHDPQLGSYLSFFDHAWARRFSELVSGSTLDEPAMALLVNWKAAANTHLMPWLMITNLTSFAKAYARSHETLSEVALGRIARHLTDAMRDSLSNMKCKRLNEEIIALGDKLKTSREHYDDDMDPQELFEEYLGGTGGHELQLSLWGTQRLVYGSIYYSYEHFVTCCVGHVLRAPDYRPNSGKKLVEDAKRALSPKAFSYCIENESVQVARLVRNAIAHHGGKESDELKLKPHGIHVADGELQVMPQHVRGLFEMLKDRAHHLAIETLSVADALAD